MEAEWRVARARLRDLVRANPSISHGRAAGQVGYSVAWVRKWRQRFATARVDDDSVVQSLSRRPNHSPTRISAEAEERVVELRTSLAGVYHRTVGARTIFAYLQLVPALSAPWPHSTATIWRILRRRQYIPTPAPSVHHPFLRPAPGTHWELDFCTIAQRSEAAPAKQQHGLEVLNVVDRGTSAVIDSHAAVNYDAEYTLLAVARMLAANGVPPCIVVDRDPRLVGSNSTADPFPSAFIRYLLCLGCEPTVLPPHRPDLKPFVERFQRTLQEEGIRPYRPTTAQAANELLATYCRWYNYERPHQGEDNLLQPPGQRLPPPTTRPALPEWVDPDSWLAHYDKRQFRRQVDARGSVQLWKHNYYLGRCYTGQRCTLTLEAATRSLRVEVNAKVVKALPLKGLTGQLLAYDTFLGVMVDDARSDWKTYLWRQQRLHGVNVS